jgi:DNA-directed RNA polymerase specialized sigma24 family protein
MEYSEETTPGSSQGTSGQKGYFSGTSAIPGTLVVDTADPEDLLQRMRAGDSDAVGTFFDRYESRIRRRIRGKLNPPMRRLFDSQEIFSTLGRRLCMYVQAGKLGATNQQQLWALLTRMANNAVIDKSRVFRRLRDMEGEDSVFAQGMLAQLQRAERHSDQGVEVEISEALNLFTDSDDRQILSLWLIGKPHSQIAFLVQLPADTVRKRWQKIREKLQDRFGPSLGA